MHMISKVLIALVAIIHAYILVLEMFLWESRGPKVFAGFPIDLFAETTAMAANQGLYNGFLFAGLIWSLVFIKDTKWRKNIALYFLLCVVVAGIYGAATVSVSIIYVQTVPALLAILSLVYLKPSDVRSIT